MTHNILEPLVNHWFEKKSYIGQRGDIRMIEYSGEYNERAKWLVENDK